jgi:hypothetical protein
MTVRGNRRAVAFVQEYAALCIIARRSFLRMVVTGLQTVVRHAPGPRSGDRGSRRMFDELHREATQSQRPPAEKDSSEASGTAHQNSQHSQKTIASGRTTCGVFKTFRTSIAWRRTANSLVTVAPCRRPSESAGMNDIYAKLWCFFNFLRPASIATRSKTIKTLKTLADVWHAPTHRRRS